MRQAHLTDQVKTILVELSAAAGQTELTSDVIDMSGFRGARFIGMLGDVTTASVLTLNLKSNSANSTSSPTPTTETSATFTAGASDADGKTLICDCKTPTGRYVFATLTRTAADAVVVGILCELYDPYVLPVTADSNVISTSKVVKGGVA